MGHFSGNLRAVAPWLYGSTVRFPSESVDNLVISLYEEALKTPLCREAVHQSGCLGLRANVPQRIQQRSSSGGEISALFGGTSR